jgi:hypothetical protein
VGDNIRAVATEPRSSALLHGVASEAGASRETKLRRQPSWPSYTAARPIPLGTKLGGAIVTKNEFYDFVMGAFRPTKTLIGMVPADKLDWRPGPTFMSLGQLINHLTEPLGDGLRCLITNQWPFTPEQMEAGMKLENIPSCNVEQALERLGKDLATLREVLDSLTEEDFAQMPVSTPWGWKGKLEAMALSFREHFTNHKMQLFLYLKLLGLPVNTETLYGA